MTDTSTKNDYSSTLYLPQTEFPMRAGLPQKEPELAARWKNMELYKKLRASAAGRPKFVLHDGPPYANGNIHIGHALNKILKDVITRSFQMRGFDSNYVPGWDCHGLPIEWKIEEKYRAKGKNKDDIPINEFRKECRDFAAEWIKVQSAEFQRLGIEGDFDNPYTTMAFHAESRIAGELLKIAKSGQLYRGSKPVMWSVVERTALAEAEVEYQDYESDTIWVKFPVVNTGWETSIKTDPLGREYLVDSEGEVVSSLLSGNPGADAIANEIITNHNQLKNASVVIWTTTPWTIPGNRAIAYSSKLDYGIYKVVSVENDFGPQEGELLIFASKLVNESEVKAKIKLQLVRKIEDAELLTLICRHPLQKLGYNFRVQLIDADHVTDDTGTGFVHTAPGHGREDYDAWMRHNFGLFAQTYDAKNNRKTLKKQTEPFDIEGLVREIEKRIPFTVDDAGFLTKDAPGFGPDAEGGPARVIDDAGKKGDANPRVIKALIEANALFARGRLKHTYPHSWRSGKPVIFRNTPQWFVYMDKELGENGPSSALRAPSPRQQGEGVEASAELPLSPHAGRGSGNAGGEGQITGTPHPEVHAQHASKDEGQKTLRSTALKAIDDTRFVPAAGQNRLRAMIENRPDWVLSRQRAWGVPICVFADVDGNILDDDAVNARILEAFEKEGADAWFADGAKERFLGNEHDAARWKQVRDILDVWFDSGSTHTFTLEDRPDLKWPADVYLEGSDQHRGWFHSSLLESCATRGRAPYKTVVTHGFIMDEKGEKMSKSKGNVVAPQDIMKEAGADILRLWVMTSDYAEDLRVGKTIIQTNIDAYRKIRNTIRWILGTLAHDTGEEIALADMPELEQLMLHRLAELDLVVRDGYDAFDFKKISRALIDFMNVELSAFYFDVRKDTLYCDAPSSLKRRASLNVIRKIFECLVTWFAPMLPFTTEEAWLSRNPSATSVHLEQFPTIPADWKNDDLADKWKKIRTVRKAVTGALEIERASKTIGSSLEAAPIVYVNDPALLEAIANQDFAEICITSAITIRSDEAPEGAFRLDDGTKVAVVPSLAEGTKCARSWRITTDVGSDPDYPDVSARDAATLRELAAMK